MDRVTLSKILFESLIEVPPNGLNAFPEKLGVSTVKAQHIIALEVQRVTSNRFILTT